MHFSVGSDQKCNITIILIKGSFSRKKKKKMEPLSENPVKKIALKKTLPKIQPWRRAAAVLFFYNRWKVWQLHPYPSTSSHVPRTTKNSPFSICSEVFQTLLGIDFSKHLDKRGVAPPGGHQIDLSSVKIDISIIYVKLPIFILSAALLCILVSERPANFIPPSLVFNSWT